MAGPTAYFGEDSVSARPWGRVIHEVLELLVVRLRGTRELQPRTNATAVVAVDATFLH